MTVLALSAPNPRLVVGAIAVAVIFLVADSIGDRWRRPRG